MPSLNDFISKLATKAGIAADNPALVAILADKDLADKKFDTKLADDMEAGLYTIEAAKAKIGEEMRRVTTAEVHNGMDKELMDSLVAMGIDADTLEAIKAEKRTPTRYMTAMKLLTELEKKKAGADKPDKAQYTEQINQLKQTIANIEKAKKEELEKAQNDAELEILQAFMEAKLAGYEYAFDGVPKDVSITTAKGVLAKQLATDKAKVSRDKNTGRLVLLAEDGSKYFDKQNNEVAFDAYVDQVVSTNKMIKASQSAKNPNEVIMDNHVDQKVVQASKNLQDLYDSEIKTMTPATGT